MKKTLIFSVASVTLGLLFSGCGETPPAAADSGPGEPAHSVEEEVPSSGFSEEDGNLKVKSDSAAESVINYGTGATQLKIKRNKTRELQNIQDSRNRQIEDMLED